MNKKLILLKRLIAETIQTINESALTSDILDSALKNARTFHNNAFDVPAEDFKEQVEKTIKFIEDRAKSPAGKKFPSLSVGEKFALTDLLERIPDNSRVGPRDVYLAKQQIETSAPAAPAPTKIDMNALPSPAQVNVQQLMARLARELPSTFGPESESDEQTSYTASLVSPADKAFFSHGMEYGASNNAFGDEKKIFPKDAAGNVIRRPDGSIVYFKTRPRISVEGVLYDVYTNSFVSHDIFERREKVYRKLWEKGQLPSPTAMKNSILRKRV